MGRGNRNRDRTGGCFGGKASQCLETVLMLGSNIKPVFPSFGYEKGKEGDSHTVYSRQLEIQIWNSGAGIELRENHEYSFS